MVTLVADAVGGRAVLDEWAVLVVLADSAGCPMSRIAELTHALPPATTKLVDRMVADGLVYRRTDITDRRRVLAFATPRGRERHECLTSLVDAAIAELSHDDRLCEVVSELYRLLVTNRGT